MATHNPSIRQRAQLAWRVFRAGMPRTALDVKKSPFVFPAFRRGRPDQQLNNFSAFVDEGFNANALIYEAIMYKVRAKWLAPLKAWTGRPDQPEPLPPNDPLAMLVARPNPHMNQLEFEGLNIVYINLAGNYYVWLDRPRKDELPRAMYPLRPDRTFIVPDPRNARDILGYLYVPEGKAMQDGKPILAQDIMHVKLPNPGDPLEGLGQGATPMSSLARSADVDNQVTVFLQEFFERGLMPNVLLQYDVPLDDATVSAIRSRWTEIYGGTEGWLKPGVMDQGGKAQQLGYSFDEMGFDVIDERNETRILGPLGVPAVLVGARVGLANATFSNVEGLDRVFWQTTFVPELRLYEAEYQYFLRTDDTFVAYDFSQVPALTQDQVELTNAAHQQWQMGVPANQAFRNVGLEFENVPGGDIGYIPLSLLPSGVSVAETTEGASTPEATDEEDRKAAFWETRALDARNGGTVPKVKAGFTPAQKERLWKQVDSIARSWEKKFESAVERRMQADLRELLAIVSAAKALALKAKQTVNWENVNQDFEAYFAEFGDAAWSEEFTPLVRGVVADQGAAWLEVLELGIELGPQFRNIPGEAWFQNYMLKFAQPINATTLGDIHLMTSQALAEGWSIPQMSKQLGLTYDRYLDPNFSLDGRRLTEQGRQWFLDRQPRYRRDLIARTESISASNNGSFALFEQWGVRRKEWLTTLDGRERLSHGLTNEQKREIGKNFDVQGTPMMHPHDRSAPIREWANCRCTLLPSFDESESSLAQTEALAARERVGFDSTEDANKWLNENNSINPNLSPQEDAAFQHYKADGYLDINDDLREAGYSEDDRVDLIEAAIERSTLDSPTIAYRGADIDMLDDFDFSLIGDEIEDAAFVSTSLNRKIAESHADGLMFEIHVPKGTKAINMERWKVGGFPQGEAELLLQRDARFKVISDNFEDDPDIRLLILEMLL